MSDERTGNKRIAEGIETIVDEAEAAVKSAFRRSGAESLSGNLKETIQSAPTSRKNVVMVRLNEDSLRRVDDLVEAGVVRSRSEASAFLIVEGIKAKRELFGRISEKIDTIRAARQELRDLVNEPPDQGEAEASDTTPSADNWDGDVGDESAGRSPNDDRSDSMNPNNDAHQATMDNRSDQLNPNNPAYHSSRGRG